MRSRLASLLAATGLVLLAVPGARATAPGGKDVTATLFQWSFDSVAGACTDVLGPAGYGYVEVSPAQEHIAGPQWWTSYQPVSYRIAGRLGDERAFRHMVRACHRAGVKVIADAVVNHMSTGAGTGTGTGGSPYAKYDYPGYYRDPDFHGCRQFISDYSDRHDVQDCELNGLADLDTGGDGPPGATATFSTAARVRTVAAPARRTPSTPAAGSPPPSAPATPSPSSWGPRNGRSALPGPGEDEAGERTAAPLPPWGGR